MLVIVIFFFKNRGGPGVAATWNGVAEIRNAHSIVKITRSRTFLTAAVDACALVNGGQHLFFGTRPGW